MPVKKTNKKEDATPQETEVEATSAPEPTQEESMPVSLVQKLMYEMEEKLSNKFKNQIDKLKLHKAKEELDEDLDYVEGLEDDWLEKPILSSSSCFVLPSYSSIDMIPWSVIFS